MTSKEIENQINVLTDEYWSYRHGSDTILLDGDFTVDVLELFIKLIKTSIEEKKNTQMT